MSNSEPLHILDATVLTDWIDYNGHMNVGYYNVAFDKATDALFDELGIGVAYVRTTNRSFFTLETHVHYVGEVLEGAPLRYDVQLLDHDPKRIHAFFRMFHATEGFLSATSEQMCLHVDLETRRSAEMPAEVLANVDRLAASQKDLAWPEQAGQGMRIRRKS
ncbi:MAG: thioesterase family protein [Minwuia sp.]|nr:thioesterase family protein [Minwuia sp.]